MYSYGNKLALSHSMIKHKPLLKFEINNLLIFNNFCKHFCLLPSFGVWNQVLGRMGQCDACPSGVAAHWMPAMPQQGPSPFTAGPRTIQSLPLSL